MSLVLCECANMGLAIFVISFFSLAAAEDGASLLYCNTHDIRKYDLATQQDSVVMSGLNNAYAVDYHLKNKVIVWTDSSDENIYSAPLWSDGSRPTVLVKNVYALGLAVDWIHDRIYFTNYRGQSVAVVEMDGSMRKTIIDTGIGEPRAIALNPAEGFMFISDTGTPPKIMRSNMDGSNRKDIVATDILEVTSLTIDLKSRQIFWVDYNLKNIGTAKFDGSHRANLYGMKEQPISVDVYENHLYYTTYLPNQYIVYTIGKHGATTRTKLFNGENTLEHIKIHYSSRQPQGRNVCGDHNGGCSHLCLPSSAHTFSCACPDGLNMSSDNISCLSPEGKLHTATTIMSTEEASSSVSTANTEPTNDYSVLGANKNSFEDIKDSNQSGAALLGVVIGVFVIVFLLALIGVVIYMRNRLNAFSNDIFKIKKADGNDYEFVQKH